MRSKNVVLLAVIILFQLISEISCGNQREAKFLTFVILISASPNFLGQVKVKNKGETNVRY